MNSLFVIAPYKYQGMWVFDDERVELVREPFVSGADTMIDKIVKDIPDAHDGFHLIFSATPFPGCNAKLLHLREEFGGNWYSWPESALEGWLCPALSKYFAQAPPEIYVRAAALSLVEQNL